MTQEVLSQCLDPFFTTKGEGGTGLGLPMVYGVVQRHGGKIRIDSQPGAGTSVILRFPLKRLKAAASGTDGQGTPHSRSLKILCVDDETIVRSVIIDYLRYDGHRVDGASSGEEALRMFLAGNYDLVITDRAMPGMNGDMLTEKIKASPGPRPVIMLSGTADLLSEEREPDGVDILIAKPVNLQKLRSAVERVFAWIGPSSA